MTKCYIKDYPRPQFVRKDWINLNGKWQFLFDDQDVGEKQHWYQNFPSSQTIEVPFSYECLQSGIGETIFHPVLWYQRTFFPKTENDKRVCLHFEGSDYITKVWINGQFAGIHTGGYTRFTFDITDLLTAGENVITVQVKDSDDLMQPRGKQRWKKDNFGCWYVQTSGIWKPVWIEYRSAAHLEKVKLTPKLSDETLELQWQVQSDIYGTDLVLQTSIFFQDQLVNQLSVPVLEQRGCASIKIASTGIFEWRVKTWSPEHPDLYDIHFELYYKEISMDSVDSYFGMRDIRIEAGNVLLNGVPVYQKLVLDQGYWQNSNLTAPSEEALLTDIERIKELGFNGVRKHQKIEDNRFAYWCDVKGLLLWCEMPSTYTYGDDAVHNFTKEWLDVVDQHYNHPSIITWVPFNESWGISQVETNRLQQHFTEAVYHLTKSIDSMRPVIVNDGWEHTISDIITLHDYEECGDLFFKRYSGHKEEILKTEIFHNGFKSAMANGYSYSGQPIIISEYGGAAFNGGKSDSWGYGNNVESEEAFIARMDKITSAIKNIPYISGYCYTQITDVQQEINGLLDMERQPKVSVSAIREINQKETSYFKMVYK